MEDSQYVEALKDRDKAWDNLAHYMRHLSKLSGEDPNATVFMDLHLEIKEAMRTLDAKEDTCNSLIANNCKNYEDNDNYSQSLDDYDTAVCTWMELLGKEFDRVHGTTTPVKAEQGSDNVVQAMLTQMQKQTDVIQLAIQSNIDKNKGPRPPTPVAPSFFPVNDLNDCKC